MHRAATVIAAVIATVCMLLVVGVGGVAQAADPVVAPLPKRARLQDDGRYASPLGFRDTIEFYRKTLAKKGQHAVVGPVQKHRDVAYVRILPTASGSAWAAIHVVQLADGKTFIYIVARLIEEQKPEAVR